MSRIFIFSDPLGTYSLLYTVEYLLNSKIDSIILADEVVIENIINNFSFSILRYESIEACISNADMILIYNSIDLPEYTIRKIENISTIQSKKCIDIKSYEAAVPEKEAEDLCNTAIDVPAVAIFSMGLATFPTKVEFDLSKIFADVKASCLHFGSLNAKHIIREFKKAGIIRDELLCSHSKQADVSVYYFDLNNDIRNIHKYHDKLATIRPDYTIVLTDFDLSDYDEIFEYIGCFCMRDPDVVVKSRWFSIGNNMFCHSDNFMCEKQNYILDFEDKSFIEKLRFDILSKITLAEGMKRIQ